MTRSHAPTNAPSLGLPDAVIELLPAAPSVREVTPGGPWLVTYTGQRTVLRRYPPERYPPGRSLDHVRWLHDFLRTVGHIGFPAPMPVDDLAGESLSVVSGAIWELLTYLPGRALGWCRRASLWQTGEIIARFHMASEAVSGTLRQRPGALPLSECRPTTTAVAKLVRDVHDQLNYLDHESARCCVIHGDPTSQNVLVGGRPSRPIGLIDFTLAYREAAAADLAFALWRSGRPSQKALHYDLGRVTSLVNGYQRIRPLEAAEADLVPIYLLGRGLQMLARSEARGLSDPALLARLDWVYHHQEEIRRVVEDAR